ncbi:MAG: hypothetical protein AAF570_16755, partial [Bacteroidota bacterium]
WGLIGPPCKLVLDSLEKYGSRWEAEYGVKIVVIMDHPGKGESSNRVKTNDYFERRRWRFTAYWDVEGGLVRWLDERSSHKGQCPQTVFISPDREKSLIEQMIYKDFRKEMELRLSLMKYFKSP